MNELNYGLQWIHVKPDSYLASPACLLLFLIREMVILLYELVTTSVACQDVRNIILLEIISILCNLDGHGTFIYMLRFLRYSSNVSA